MSLRCKDERFPHPKPASWFVPWCPYSRPLRYEDIKDKVNFFGKYSDGRCINWLRFCSKTEKVVVHNKKCDVPEVIEKLNMVLESV